MYLKVPPSFVSKMLSGAKQIPIEQCVPIERFTAGMVTCEEMRPDKAADFAYLRGIAEPVTDAENIEPDQAPALTPPAQAAMQSIALCTDCQGQPPGPQPAPLPVAAPAGGAAGLVPAQTAYTGPDRRKNPEAPCGHPDLERREPIAASLAGQDG